jgi:hypothetical protein
MKIYNLLIITCLFVGLDAAAQTNSAEQLAQRQALRMKDSLDLDTSLHQKILNINRWLYQQKLWVRQQTTNADSLAKAIQRVENKRDSLYQAVLPDNKFSLYKQRKPTLISNQ